MDSCGTAGGGLVFVMIYPSHFGCKSTETFVFDSSLQDLPNTFTPFRNKVEKALPIPKKINLPSSDLPCYKLMEPLLTKMPTLAELGYTQEQIDFVSTNDPRGVMEKSAKPLPWPA